MVFETLVIRSPKRSLQTQQSWDGFFPYYAGFPESFARSLLKSASLPKQAVVWDPWNGSGTTTFSAAQLGLASRGFDLNPVMIVIARARLLPPSEADSLESLARDTVKGVRADLRADDAMIIERLKQTLMAIKLDSVFINMTTGGGKNSPGPLNDRITFVERRLLDAFPN